MQAQDAPQGTRRALINGAIIILIFVLAVNALPTFFSAQYALRETFDPYIDGFGLWQGQWELFGPMPDKLNANIVAVVTFEDGKHGIWSLPDPRQLSLWEKFRYFRWFEYADGVRLDSNRRAWPVLANYALHQIEHPDRVSARPKRISLWRTYVEIPTPSDPLRPMSDPFLPNRKYRIFAQELLP